MFVAPLLIPEHSTTSRATRASRRVAAPASVSRSDSLAPTVLLLWLVAGCALLLLAPIGAFEQRFGATLPYWLVGAPLLDLVWLWRARLHRAWSRLRTRRSAFDRPYRVQAPPGVVGRLSARSRSRASTRRW